MPPGRPIAVQFESASGGAAVSSLVRASLVVAVAAREGKRADEIARRMYNGDRGVETVLKSAVSPTTLSGSPAATQIGVAFLDALTPASAGADLLGRGVRLNFAGAASIAVPGIAIPNASFIAEGSPIPVKQGTTSVGPTLSPHKLASICVLTGELIRSSNAETMTRQVLVESTGPALDAALFSANAASAIAPAGLLNGIAALTPATAGPAKGEVLIDDLQKLAAAVAPVAGNGNVVAVASPDAAVALAMRVPTALEWPILTSAALAARTIIVVAANAVVSAVDGAPLVDARGEVTLHMADPASEVVDVGGVRATPVGSTFQTDNVALRLRWPISWALRDSRGIAWMTNVNW
jgi:Phage capsid family